MNKLNISVCEDTDRGGKKWKLSDTPENYKWSSAKFYEIGDDDFGFLTNISSLL
jgi:hypothetical protein